MNERIAHKSILQSIRQAKYTSEAAKERSLPVYTTDISDKSIVSILEEYVMLWEPRDLRLDPEYQRTHEVIVTDDLFMQDLAKGMKLQVEERIPTKNTIKVAVLFQHNMSEFERYNDVIDSHNKKWFDQGCPEDVFDPTTGDVVEIKDKYLNYAGEETINPFGGSTGKLALAKPEVTRRKMLTVTYRLDINQGSGGFNLKFNVEDYRGNIVYYNTLKGKNLSYLIRRSTQEMYGNPEVYGNSGPFLEGISMLFTGKKLGRCAIKNEFPKLSPNRIKNPVVEQATLAAGSSGLKTMGYLIRYIVPVVSFITIIFKTFSALSQNSLEGVFFIYGISLSAMYASVIISGWIIRKSYALDINRKFI